MTDDRIDEPTPEGDEPGDFPEDVTDDTVVEPEETP
jgi:hypothetical protein